MHPPLKNERETLLEEKAKVEGILSSIADGLVVVDEHKKVALINHSAERVTGWSNQEVFGKDWSDVVLLAAEDGTRVPENDRPLALGLHQRIPTNQASIFQYTRKDGTTFIASITVSPVKVKNKTIGAILVFRDVTHDREVDKIKTEFVSLASHQLRTPLATIRWYAEILSAEDSGPLNENQKKILGEIYEGGRRMADLVNALLNVARLEMGTFLVEPKPTDVIALMQDVVAEQKPQCDEKHIHLDEAYAGNVPFVNIDPGLLRMVLQNILSNAIKYTPKGGKITSEITVIDTQNKKPHFRIRVADTGYGIPEQQQEKIFTKLFRADNVREKDTDGTGLGLYIVKSIIDASGGKVWFESEENVGSTFYVELPLDGMKRKEGTKTLA